VCCSVLQCVACCSVLLQKGPIIVTISQHACTSRVLHCVALCCSEKRVFPRVAEESLHLSLFAHLAKRVFARLSSRISLRAKRKTLSARPSLCVSLRASSVVCVCVYVCLCVCVCVCRRRESSLDCVEEETLRSSFFARLFLARRTATHCNTLQHTATRCNALQRAATRCNALQRAATHCNALQRAATRCNTLQHTATHCNAPQRTATRCNALQHTTTHCNALQRTATHCDSLQRTATCCNALQHVATH